MGRVRVWWGVTGVLAACMAGVVCAAPAAASFGFQAGSFDNVFLDEGGVPAVRAGSHPLAVTTSFKFNTKVGSSSEVSPDQDVKDVEVALPPGLVGDPTATPKCAYEQFTKQKGSSFRISCPNDSQVGVAVVELRITGVVVRYSFGIYNLVPPPGVPAAFGLNVVGIPILLTPRIRTGGDYGATIVSKNTSQARRIYGIEATIWGVPSASSHDGERGECLGPLGERFALGEESPCLVESSGTPFLTLPTSCSADPLATTIYADSWQNPVPFALNLNLEEAFNLQRPEVVREVAFNHDSTGHSTGVSGCEHLDFSPSVAIAPSTKTAGSPAGLSVGVTLPQNESANGLAEADLKRAVVSLPAGVSISPSAANGREACTEEEIALSSAAPVRCPDASKVGTVEIQTPLLETPLDGWVYIAQQAENPFGSLFALYVVAEGSGVVVKLAGEVHADPASGQLTTTFGGPRFVGTPRQSEGLPQQPFGHLEMTFFPGPRAALVTPRACGTYSTSGVLSPWSGALSAVFSDPFEINAGCGGGFSPTMLAGTLSSQAGGFSPFALTLSRGDQEQAFRQLSLRTPPGLLGMLSKVQLCEEPQAAQQACPPASQIGHVTIVAGPGSRPLVLPQPGKPEDPVYLTGPYNGAPFGLLTIVHAEAGPFNLGPVPVRATLNVERRTSRIVATSDPLPTVVKGVPVDLKTLNITLDHPGFTFNPTNCAALKFEGTIGSDEGATAPLTSPFQATNCATLPFHPAFKASTGAHPTHLHGASLDVKVTYAKGTQANIAAVKVSLPRQLPSRLTTLQHACPEATFAANPATCPPESSVGTATATTPVLNTPVSGPAYLVSHGGAAFPDLVMILQGEGVTVELVGNTDVSKAGITTSTFPSVPDVPISSFELQLPQGSHSALTENLPRKTKDNFCTTKLTMPTVIVAQNGAHIRQNTKIAVTGCPKRAKVHARRRV
jgi:hypothetical protein